MNPLEMFFVMNQNTSPNPSPLNVDNPYFIVPEKPEVSQLSIPKSKTCFFIIFFMSIFLMATPLAAVINAEIAHIYGPCCIIPLIIILLCFKYKVVLIKDKENNRLIVKEKNYFCCNTKSWNIPLAHSDIKIIYNFDFDNNCSYFHCRSGASIAVLNADPNVTDIDNNNIKNTPFKFIYIITNIKEKLDLSLNIESFIGKKFNNNIVQEINLYVPNPFNENNHFTSPDNVFVKISEHFYMFYNYKYFSQRASKENFQRLDWIYTDNFDRIFIGVVKDDTTYINNFTYNIQSIDKFIIEIREGKLCLKVMLKNGLNYEICRYTREKEKDLDTFIYLINGQINKINNGNNQAFLEKPELQDNSAPTLK